MTKVSCNGFPLTAVAVVCFAVSGETAFTEQLAVAAFFFETAVFVSLHRADIEKHREMKNIAVDSCNVLTASSMDNKKLYCTIINGADLSKGVYMLYSYTLITN
jgi:hypothetical protein